MNTSIQPFPLLNDPTTSLLALVVEDEPYFLAKQLADLLGYSDTHEMLTHVDTDDRMTYTAFRNSLKTLQTGESPVRECATILDTYVQTLHNRSLFITESGMYASIFGSKKPEAKEFKRWVFAEVLPSIRKNGNYSKAAFEEELERDRLQAIHDERIKEIKANSAYKINNLTNGRLLPVTTLLKKYGKATTTRQFMAAARSNNIVYNDGSSVHYTAKFEFYGDSIKVGNTYQLRVYENLFNALFDIIFIKGN